MKRLGILSVCVIAMLASLPSRAPAAETRYSDVPDSYYAAGAIDLVAVENDWMRFSGDEFHPGWRLTRKVLARALARAFAREELTSLLDGGSLAGLPSFSDLDAGDPFYPFAAIAASKRWLPAGDTFRPDASVSKRVLDRALVRALGLQPSADALASLTTGDGARLKMPPLGEYMVIAHELRLHYNFPSKKDARERYPWNTVNRGYAAYALARAYQASQGWEVYGAKRFETISLPKMTAAQREAAAFALRYAGYPYVYAGEWHRRSWSGYCCGYQARGGFDCSGFAWWVMKAADGGWKPSKVRPYEGWSLGGRRGRDMARVGTRRAFEDLRPMDLLFFDTEGVGTGDWDATGHVGMYLGNGWMVHSSGGRDGVTVSYIGEGSWWRGTFLWGRRLIY